MEQYRPVPMRLFATWEVDRASTNSVPRLCNMTLNRLTILKPLESDLHSFVFAVKLQGYKRTLRSNDINVLAVNGIIDVDLDISFTLQYPHFVKRKSNSLLIMLQRRKKYKTRPIPGFKTLAVGSINLTQVLQSTVIRELPMYSDIDKATASAKLYLLNLNTQPLEQDDMKTKEQTGDYSDEDEDESTPNEDGGSDSEMMMMDDPTSNAGLIPSSARSVSHKGVKFPNAGSRFPSRQKNLKQKFVALLKKFKMSEEEGLEAAESDGFDHKPTQQEIEALFEELENLSDSGPDQGDADTLSVKSTPKPSLRPYFNSTDMMADEKQAIENISEESKESADSQGDFDTTDPEGSDVPFGGPKVLSPRSPGAEKKESKSGFNVSPAIANTNTPSPNIVKESVRQSNTVPVHSSSMDKKGKVLQKYPRQTSADVVSTSEKHYLDKIGHQNPKFSTSTTKIPIPTNKEPPLGHKPVAEQLTAMLSPEENFIPECVLLVCAADIHCQNLINGLKEKYQKLFLLTSQNDVKSFFLGLIARIQRFFNINSGHPPLVKVGIIGGDRFIGFCLKSFVETFQPKPNEWLHFVRYYFITPGWSSIGRCLATVDHNYGTYFGDVAWREWWEKPELVQYEIAEVVSKISKYFASGKCLASMPIAEAMLQLKDNGSLDEMSSQIFVPFVIDVRLGVGDSSGEPPLESPGAASQPLSGSPPNSSLPPAPASSYKFEINQPHGSPPGSPHVPDRDKAQTSPFASLNEAQDLQIEYWTHPNAAGIIPFSGPSPGVFRSDSQGQKRESNAGASAGSTKFSLKTAFRSLAVTRVPQNSLSLLSETPAGPACLTVQFVREKKKDKMLQKLGMKNKDKIESEQKKQLIDSVSRLICSTKQHMTMKLVIDGVEWTNVKFFQISSQWQTHVKFIPIALFGVDGSA